MKLNSQVFVSLFQRDFFTKTWGDSFLEKTDIPKPHYLPDISHVHFEPYLRKIARVSIIQFLHVVLTGNCLCADYTQYVMCFVCDGV